MPLSLGRIAGVVLAALVAAAPTPTVWHVSPRPTFDIGGGDDDSVQTFNQVMGAIRTRSGEIMVADFPGSSLRVFAPNGHFIRSAIRHGQGPGEMPTDILRLMHCGDSLYVMDWNSVEHVYDEQVRFSRLATIVPALRGDSPYAIACNPAGLSISYGWDRFHPRDRGNFRVPVPFWLNNADGSLRASLGDHPGSERFADMVDGSVRGTGPLPLGKQSVVAIGRDRAYIGTADSGVVDVYSLTGEPLGVVRIPVPQVRTTQADIERFLALDTAGTSEASKTSRMRRLNASVDYPRTLPAYQLMLVDREDDLWIQRYPRPGDRAAHWLVFDSRRAEIATVDLPLNLTVTEIGRDYVLGFSHEPPDGVEHIEMYDLRRAAR